MTAPPEPGREVEEPLQLAADRRDVRLERRRGRAGSARTTGPTGRRSSPSRRRRAATGRPPWRWRWSSPKIGTRWPTWSDGAGRVEPDVAGDRPSGRESGRRGRASSRGGCRATRARRAGRPTAPVAARPSQARERRGVSTTREAHEPFVHAPYAIVRPLMQTSLARRQRHRRGAASAAREGRGGTTVGQVAPRRSSSSSLVLVLPRPVAGLVGRRGRVQPLRRRACPTRRRRSTNLDFDQQTVVYDRTGKVELARLGDAQARGRHLRPDPGRDPRRDDGDRGQGLLGQPGLRPGRHRVGRPRHALRAGRAAPRRSPSSSSAPACCRPSAFDGHDLRAQGHARSSSRSA